MNPQRSPYPGLRPFNRDESDLFYGRDRCISAMVETLQETRFLAVLGPSGSGKSSLVRSGLFLDLEAGRARKAGARWTFLDIRHPRQQPYRELARELLRYECETREGTLDALEPGGGACNAPLFNPPDHALAERRRQLRKDPLALARWWKENRPDERTNLLLLVDQFEELFGYGEARERNDVEAFVDMLLKCRTNNDPAVYIVLTMRSEFLAGCTLFAGLSEQINKSLSLTPRMTREECRQAITGPAAMADVTLEPLLVTTLLNDMNSLAQWQEESEGAPAAEGAEAAPQPEGFKQTDLIARRADQLPLMQHVLNWMWLAAAARREFADEPVVLKLDDYLAIGGLTGALSRHAGEVMARTGDSEATERVFRALTAQPTVVSLGSAESSGVRRPRTLDQLVAETGVGEERVRAVVEAFRADGVSMLTPSTEIALTNDLEVDIAHESLIRQWADLRRWIREEAENGRAWRELVRDTEQEGSARAELLRGLELSDRRRWWAATKPHPGWADRYDGKFEAVDAFMARSVAGEKRRKAVRYGGTGLLTALAITAGTVTLFAWQDAKAAGAARIQADLAAAEAAKQSQAAQLKSREAARTAAEARSRAQAAQQAASEAEKAAKAADQVKRQAEAMARSAQAQSAQAQRAERQARQSLAATEARSNVLAGVAREVTSGSVRLLDELILPNLRIASSEENPRSALAIVGQISRAIKPLEQAESRAFANALMEVRLEEAELAAADLNVARLVALAQEFDRSAADPEVAEEFQALARSQSFITAGRAELLRGIPEAAIAAFQKAASLSASEAQTSVGHWAILARATAQMGLAEALFSRGSRREAQERATECLRLTYVNSSRPEETPAATEDQLNAPLPPQPPHLASFEARNIRARCQVLAAAALPEQGERLKAFEEAAELVWSLDTTGSSIETQRLKLFLVSHLLMTNNSGLGSGDYPRVEQMVESVQRSQLVDVLNRNPWAAGDYYLADALDESDLLMREWRRLVEAGEYSSSQDPNGIYLGNVTRRFNFIRTVFGNEQPVDQLAALRVGHAIIDHLGNYEQLIRTGPSDLAPTPITVFGAFKTLGDGQAVLGHALPDGDRARSALLKTSIGIIDAVSKRVSFARYDDLTSYENAINEAEAQLCGPREASLEGCTAFRAAKLAFSEAAGAARGRLAELAKQAISQRSQHQTWEDSAEVALNGHDPVSCREDGVDLGEGMQEPLTYLSDVCALRQGRYAYFYVWDGSVWLFESEDNLKLFSDNPEAWAPQFRGYDTASLIAGPDNALGPIETAIWSGSLGGRRYLFAENPANWIAGFSSDMEDKTTNLSLFDNTLYGSNMSGGNMIGSGDYGIKRGEIRQAEHNWRSAQRRRLPTRSNPNRARGETMDAFDNPSNVMGNSTGGM